MDTHPFSPVLVVSLNNNKELEYHRERELTDQQMRDLDSMEEQLDQGIHIAGQYFASPSQQEKAVFMANQLAMALTENNESVLAMASAYLATRLPDLQHLKISTHEDRLSIELIHDQEFTEQAPVKFVSKKDLL